MAEEQKLTEVGTVTTMSTTDTVVTNTSSAVKQITLSNIAALIKSIIGSIKNPNALTFTGGTSASYDGSSAVSVEIPSETAVVQTLTSGTKIGTVNGTALYAPSSSGSTTTTEDATIPRNEMTASDTSVELAANELYVFPEMETLTVTLADISDTSIVSEYHFIFTSGETATELSIPDSVTVPSSFSVDASTTYEISICEGLLAYQSWEVS